MDLYSQGQKWEYIQHHEWAHANFIVSSSLVFSYIIKAEELKLFFFWLSLEFQALGMNLTVAVKPTEYQPVAL